MVKTPDFLLNSNPWWENSNWAKTDQHLQSIKGKTYTLDRPEVKNLSKLKSGITIIRGARQVGKTTLIKSIIEKIIHDNLIQPKNVFYLSCETILDFNELEETLFPWLNKTKNKGAIFLDEISFVKDWPRTILGLANIGLIKNKILFITGSNARDLKESSERLPGRREKGKDIILRPFSFDEFKSLRCFSNLSPSRAFDLFLNIGGFPHAIRDYVSLGYVEDTTYDLYKNWIIGDAVRYNMRELILQQLLYRVYETASSRISWNKLVENTTVKSHETALNYIEHTQDAFLCNLLFCYDINKKIPSLIKAKKIYFVDPLLYYLAYAWHTGMQNIYNWVVKKNQLPEFKSRIFEAVVIDSYARNHNQTFYWYSTKTKQEVDLLLAKENDYELFEVKLSSRKKGSKMLGRYVKYITPTDFF